MPRVRRGNRKAQRRKKVLKAAKGYYGAKSRAYRVAKEAVDRSRSFAYRDRRQKKRTFRSLWILRINAAARSHGLSYSRFINGLSRAGVEINRKMLADLAVREPAAFGELADVAKQALEDDGVPASEAGAAQEAETADA